MYLTLLKKNQKISHVINWTYLETLGFSLIRPKLSQAQAAHVKMNLLRMNQYPVTSLTRTESNFNPNSADNEIMLQLEHDSTTRLHTVVGNLLRFLTRLI
jgi:hypothetical protein